MLNSSDEIQTDILIKLSAFSNFGRSLALLFVSALLFAADSLRAQSGTEKAFHGSGIGR